MILNTCIWLYTKSQRLVWLYLAWQFIEVILLGIMGALLLLLVLSSFWSGNWSWVPQIKSELRGLWNR